MTPLTETGPTGPTTAGRCSGVPPLLRLPRRRDRPVRPRAGLRQPPRRPAGHLRGRLPPVDRPGRQDHRVPQGPPGRRARRAVAHLARLRCVPRPAPGAQGDDRPLRGGVRRRLGRTARRGSPARSSSASSPPAPSCRPATTGCRPWDDHSADEQRVFTRLQAAYAAMLDHADRQIARLDAFLDESGIADDTLVLVLSDNGASARRAGPPGSSTPWARSTPNPSRWRPSSPHSTPSAGPAPTPTSRGAGPWRRTPRSSATSRTPTAAASVTRSSSRGRPASGPGRGPSPVLPCHRRRAHHARRARRRAAGEIGGVPQQPMDGASLRSTFDDAEAPPPKETQYFEMFGHRGIWHDGWKAVAYHPPYTPFEDDTWELYHLDEDFAEIHDLATAAGSARGAPGRWWRQADGQPGAAARRPLRRALRRERRAAPWRAHALRVLGRDRPRAHRCGTRSAQPQLHDHRRGARAGEGVLVAHGDQTSGYSLYVAGRPSRARPVGRRTPPCGALRRPLPGSVRAGVPHGAGEGTGRGRGTLSIDGDGCGPSRPIASSW